MYVSFGIRKMGKWQEKNRKEKLLFSLVSDICNPIPIQPFACCRSFSFRAAHFSQFEEKNKEQRKCSEEKLCEEKRKNRNNFQWNVFFFPKKIIYTLQPEPLSFTLAFLFFGRYHFLCSIHTFEHSRYSKRKATEAESTVSSKENDFPFRFTSFEL